jgi:hypothetical protein
MAQNDVVTAASPGAKTALGRCLGSFVAAVNDNPRIAKILKDWNPAIAIEATDTGEHLDFQVRGSVVSERKPDGGPVPHRVALQATEETLCRVFSGAVNPVQAHLAGRLAVFATDRDNVKLDAICMVLWGI